eukprot:4286939-Karenia_brevis.AAC.1
MVEGVGALRCKSAMNVVALPQQFLQMSQLFILRGSKRMARTYGTFLYAWFGASSGFGRDQGTILLEIDYGRGAHKLIPLIRIFLLIIAQG